MLDEAKGLGDSTLQLEVASEGTDTQDMMLEEGSYTHGSGAVAHVEQ
ncbi:hypothetical protein KIPB_016200, partial [Kipferlia bialata]|eukprot:g16200.t1